MKVGYSYWGFLADVKMNSKYEQLSTPDGNAFYSWSIIKELQRRKVDVIGIMPDRDEYAVAKLGEDAFSAWATEDRFTAYSNMSFIDYGDWKNLTERNLFFLWDKLGVHKLDYIIHEWRMLIPNRNDIVMVRDDFWQPDYLIQNALVKYCKKNNISMFVFDLDYKLNSDDVTDNMVVLELGTKWQNVKNVVSKKVYIPFDFSHINDFSLISVKNRKTELVYIGNRYERDWCIDKYLPNKCTVYGNWLEAGRDSAKRWSNITFKNRAQTADMHSIYSDAVCTVLFAKREYCEYSFMTARLIEAIFYGTLPLFIEEYGNSTIAEYAGSRSKMITVRSKEDVEFRIEFFRNHPYVYENVIADLRKRLKKMDARYFVDALEELHGKV